MALLEFLAEPYEYLETKKVKAIIAGYVAQTQIQYDHLLERFRELTGKKDPTTKRQVGYRTRVVHIGERLDTIVPDPTSRRALFEELDSYIRIVIDHMVKYSHLSYEDYAGVRPTMRPLER
jgi:type IV secretory pathway ATPase VirB11/archaellum biosynthesis ATPase